MRQHFGGKACPLSHRDQDVEVRQLRDDFVGRSGEGAPVLFDAAQRLQSLDPGLARDTHLEALHAAAVAGRLGMGMRDAAAAARAAPAAPSPQSAADVLLDGLAVRFTDGFRGGAPILKLALPALLDRNGDYEADMRWPWLACRVAADVFDDEAWHLLASRYVLIARGAGALGVLPIALMHLSLMLVFEGKLDTATALVEETDSIIDATGSRRISIPKLILAAWKGDEAQASKLIDEAQRDAVIRGEGCGLVARQGVIGALAGVAADRWLGVGARGRVKDDDVTEAGVSVEAVDEHALSDG